MKKKLILLPLIAAALLMLTGCINIGGRRVTVIGENIITGTGPMVTRNIDVADFSAVDITGNFLVVYQVASETALTVVMQENLFQRLETNVRGGTLEISTWAITITGNNRPRLYIYSPYLTAASFSGAVNAEEWDTVYGHSFTVNASGAVDIDIAVEVYSLEIEASGAVNLTLGMYVEVLDLNLSGAADARLSGFAREIDINGAGAVNLRAGSLITEGGRVDVSGASNVYLSTLENIDVNTSGLARVRQSN